MWDACVQNVPWCRNYLFFFLAKIEHRQNISKFRIRVCLHELNIVQYFYLAGLRFVFKKLGMQKTLNFVAAFFKMFVLKPEQKKPLATIVERNSQEVF